MSGEGKMKAGRSLQTVIIYHITTTNKPEKMTIQFPFLLIHFWVRFFRCNGFKLISISTRGSDSFDIFVIKNIKQKTRNTTFSGQINTTNNRCLPSSIRTLPSTLEFHQILQICSWVLPPIGNWKPASSPCPEG